MISPHAKENLGWLTGLEPATTGTTNRSSTIELQPPFRAVEGIKIGASAKGKFSQCFHLNLNLILNPNLTPLAAWHPGGGLGLGLRIRLRGCGRTLTVFRERFVTHKMDTV